MAVVALAEEPVGAAALTAFRVSGIDSSFNLGTSRYSRPGSSEMQAARPGLPLPSGSIAWELYADNFDAVIGSAFQSTFGTSLINSALSVRSPSTISGPKGVFESVIPGQWIRMSSWSTPENNGIFRVRSVFREGPDELEIDGAYLVPEGSTAVTVEYSGTRIGAHHHTLYLQERLDQANYLHLGGVEVVGLNLSFTAAGLASCTARFQCTKSRLTGDSDHPQSDDWSEPWLPSSFQTVSTLGPWSGADVLEMLLRGVPHPLTIKDLAINFQWPAKPTYSPFQLEPSGMVRGPSQVSAQLSLSFPPTGTPMVRRETVQSLMIGESTALVLLIGSTMTGQSMILYLPLLVANSASHSGPRVSSDPTFTLNLGGIAISERNALEIARFSFQGGHASLKPPTWNEAPWVPADWIL